MNPINFTDHAVLHIKKMLAMNPKGIGFRLSIKKTGCSGFSYVPDIIEEATATDTYFLAPHNLPVFVDSDALQYINGLLIDYVAETGQGLKQKRLIFINPKETGRCGCGESFTIE